MNRIGTVVIRIIVISLALGLLVFAQKQSSKPSIQSPSPSSGNTSPTEQTSNKKGRNLVAKLPAGVEGVILGNGQVNIAWGRLGCGLMHIVELRWLAALALLFPVCANARQFYDGNRIELFVLNRGRLG